MARITRPRSGAVQASGFISTEAAQAPGRAQMRFGDQIARLGQSYFEEAKAADQTAKFSKAYSEALVQFNKQADQRAGTMLDENGNPTYGTLSDDIKKIGDDITESTVKGIIDPEVAQKFRTSFGNIVTNRQVSSLSTARKQQRQFAQESVYNSLDTIGNEATVQSDTDLDMYIRQADQILDSAVAGGAIDPMERRGLAESFRRKVTAAKMESLISQDPEAARELLMDPEQASKAGLTESERKKGLGDAERAIQRQGQINKQAVLTVDKQLRSTIKDVDSLIESGGQPPAEVLESLIDKTKGTSLEQDVNNLLEKKRITQSFTSMSESAQLLTVEKLRAQGREAEAKKLSSIQTKIARAKNKDIVGFAVQQGVIGDITPIDFQGDVASQLMARNEVALKVEAQYGRENSGLTEPEIATIKERLTQGTVQDQAQLLGQIVTGYGERSYQVFSELANKGGMQQAFAGALVAENNTEAARLLLTGMNLQKERAIDLPAASNFNDYAADPAQFPLYTDPIMRNEVYKSAVSVYAALSAEKGDYSGNFNSDTFDEAVAQVTNGGPIEVDFSFFGPDSRVEPPVPGMTSDNFMDWIKGLSDDDVNELGGFLHKDEGSAADLQNFKYVTAGRGQYMLFAIEDGVEVPVLDKGGEPFILDYNKLTQPQESPSAVQLNESSEEEALKFIDESLSRSQAVEGKGFFGQVKQIGEKIMTNFGDKIRSAVSPKASPETLETLNNSGALLKEFGIDSPKRQRHFLAQLSHESAGFSAMTEQRSDVSAERKYGVGTRVGRILGNTQKGDGAKFKGRGYIQLTGRDNYERYGRKVGVDLVNNPELAAEPEIALKIAAAFWESKGLNKLADQDNLREITRRINGGYNGLADRQHRYEMLAAVEQ